jgi:hypothetical protein
MAGVAGTVIPTFGILSTGVKVGGRVGRSIKSFAAGGTSNPIFYANLASATLRGASFLLQAGSYAASITCPPIAVPLLGGAHICGTIADTLDKGVDFVSIIA